MARGTTTTVALLVADLADPCFSSIAAKRAYSGAIAARARACSASYWPVLVQFNEPLAEPRPGYSHR